MRNELVEKFDRNRKFIGLFLQVYEQYLINRDSWNNPAFTDSKITNRQYLLTLKQVYFEEYSEAQTSAIRTAFIHDNAIKEYIFNLDSQFENLKLLYNDISSSNNLLE